MLERVGTTTDMFYGAPLAGSAPAFRQHSHLRRTLLGMVTVSGVGQAALVASLVSLNCVRQGGCLIATREMVDFASA